MHRSSHKKKSKKSDDHSDSDKSKKHSEKRKKRSKEEKKLDKEKKKKKEHKRSKKEHSDLTPEPEEVSSPNIINPFTEDALDGKSYLLLIFSIMRVDLFVCIYSMLFYKQKATIVLPASKTASFKYLLSTRKSQKLEYEYFLF